jgi:dTDP-4-dehydrorhamnose 3,5-epimerase
MEIVSLDIDAVKLVRPQKHVDARGDFVETWNQRAFAAAGLDADFAQNNVSFSRSAGTIRGFHVQRPPAAQAKLVRVARGSIFDVAVDLRRSSKRSGAASRRR